MHRDSTKLILKIDCFEIGLESGYFRKFPYISQSFCHQIYFFLWRKKKSNREEENWKILSLTKQLMNWQFSVSLCQIKKCQKVSSFSYNFCAEIPKKTPRKLWKIYWKKSQSLRKCVQNRVKCENLKKKENSFKTKWIGKSVKFFFFRFFIGFQCFLIKFPCFLEFFVEKITKSGQKLNKVWKKIVLGRKKKEISRKFSFLFTKTETVDSTKVKLASRNRSKWGRICEVSFSENPKVFCFCEKKL